MKKSLLTLCILILSVAASAQQGRNRKIVSDYPMAHDPVVAFCEGKYYLFTTGYGISVMSSTDMKTWESEAPALSEIPKWALETVPGYRGHTWAPDIFHHDGRWYLYYSCSSFGKNTSAIGVASNKTLNPDSPDFKWVDHGPVVESVASRDDWNAIDPNIIMDENGDAWMNFGSFWGGIKMVKLDKTLTKVAKPELWHRLCYRPAGSAPSHDDPSKAVKSNNGAVEAPFIFKKGDWYYLFVSYDMCCRGEESTYKVVVGRSDKVTGPYYDHKGVSLMKGGGTIVVESNPQFAGVGHSATVTFDGKDYLFFHGYDMKDAGRAHLMIREIEWNEAGWPKVTL